MRKATAIYHAPQGDNKVVEMGGVTFFDGKEVDLNSDDNGHLISKLEGNPCFDIDVGEDDGQTKKKRGRPSNADKAAKDAANEPKKVDAGSQAKPAGDPAPVGFTGTSSAPAQKTDTPSQASSQPAK